MIKVYKLLFLLLICSGFIMVTGCNPHSSIVLSNDASLKKLNDMVKERSVRVTTTDSIYTGENITIKRDSTVIENYSKSPRVIPYSSMKNISYVYGKEFLDGYIILNNNQSIKAQNIVIANKDTMIRFDEIITTSVIFPSKDLIKIQRKEHTVSTFNGLGYGCLSGAVAGAIVGVFLIGHVGDVPDNSNMPNGSGQATSPVFTATLMGAFFGTIGGTLTGAILGQWEDIDITYQYEHSSP